MPDVTVDILAQMEGADKVTRDLDKLNKEGEELHKTFSAQVLGIGINRLDDSIKDSIQDANRLSSALDSVEVNELVDDTERFVSELRQATHEAARLKKELGNRMLADFEASKIAGGKSGTTARGGRNQGENASQVLSNLSQLTGLGGIQAAADFVDLATDATQALGGLGAALPAVGVGAIAAGGALLIVNDAFNRGKKIAEEAAESHDKYLRLLELGREADDLNANDLNSRIDETRHKLEDETAARDAYIAEVAKELSESKNLTQAMTGITAALGLEVGLYGEAKEKLDTYNDSIDEQTAALQRLEAETNRANRQTEVERAAASGEKAAQSAIDSLTEEQDFLIWVREQERNATVESATDAINALEMRKAADEEASEFLKERITELQRLMEGETDAAELARMNGELETFQSSLKTTEDSLSMTDKQLEAFNESILPAAESIQRLKEVQEANAKMLATTQKDFTASANQRDAAEQRLLATEGQLAALESDRAKMMERQAQEDALAASQDARESALEAQIDVAKAAAEVTQIQTEAASKQVQITSQLRDNINAINAEFMRSELRAIQAFNLEQKRLREDTEDELKQAALDNDVNAFLAARDSAVKQLSRGSEDFGIERAQAKEDRDLRLAELKQSAQQELELLKVETQNQLITLQQGGEARLAQVRALEEQLLVLRDRFAQENRLLQERFQQEDYNARVQALNETLTLNRNNFETLQKQTANLAYQVGIAAAKGFFAGAQGTVDASIQVAINQGVQELAGG